MFEDDVINLDTNLAEENIGDIWTNFIESITPAHGEDYNAAYNLVALLGKVDDTTIFINHILIDDSISKENKSAEIRVYLINSLIDSLQIMGVGVDKDFIGPNNLKDLINVVNAFYTLHDMNDLLGIAEILQSEDFQPLDKLIEVVDRLYLDYDVEILRDIIVSVESKTIKGILVGLNLLDEDGEHVEGYIKERVIKNKPFLKGTLGFDHVVNDGALGLDMNILFNIHVNKLAELLASDHAQYHRQILSLMLISSLVDTDIVKSFKILVNKHTEDIGEAYKLLDILTEVNLNE